MAREGVPLNVIQRQLGHADLGVTSVYVQGIDNTEVISAVRSRQGAGDAGKRRIASVVGGSPSRMRERRGFATSLAGLVRSEGVRGTHRTPSSVGERERCPK
jgi:hypothetical protein